MTMQVGIKEVRNNLSELLKKVEAGEQITITRHGRPVARIVPEEYEVPPFDNSEFRERMGGDYDLTAALLKDREEARY
jgi:prevent-host-death family protein